MPTQCGDEPVARQSGYSGHWKPATVPSSPTVPPRPADFIAAWIVCFLTPFFRRPLTESGTGVPWWSWVKLACWMSPPNWFAGRRFISLIVASSSPILARRSSFSGIARPFGARHEIRPALRPVEIEPVVLHVLALHHVASL